MVGLPATFPCEAGTVSRELTVPADIGARPVAYELTLTAVGAGGRRKAKARVKVSPQSRARPCSR